MQKLRQSDLLVVLFLLLVLVVLLGLAPRIHQDNQDLQEAQRALTFGQPREAAKHMASAAERAPQRFDLWELAGSYALQGDDPEAAIDYLERVGQDRLTAPALLDLGDAYWQVGDNEAAIQIWQAVLPLDEELSKDASQRLADTFQGLGDYDAAIASLQALAAFQPDQARWHYQLGLLLATQRPEDALDHLAQAAKLDSDLTIPAEEVRRAILDSVSAEHPAVALLNAGRALAALGEWALAREAFRNAVEMRPDYAEAWAYLGEASQHIDEQDRDSSPDVVLPQYGLLELETAVALNPESLAAQVSMALYWTRQADYDKAKQAIQAALDLDGQNPVLWVEAGNIQALSGDLQAAHEAYNYAVALAKDAPEYLRYLADFSLKYGYHVGEIALPAVRQAVAQAPRDAKNLIIMARVMVELGDLVSGERFLHRALQYDPSNAQIYLHLAQLYLLNENKTAAYLALEQVRARAPDTPVADQAQRLLEIHFP